ncbi:siderophore ABC transporter substrate-binding protein [Fulvimarina sp. MAC8]|uniref:siderophore ABC transporter substrate-binding protein n=1 Tax=Fulvimarina sp. MAC8 TaxID=3162874 RepID=UPI0032EBA0BF
MTFSARPAVFGRTPMAALVLLGAFSFAAPAFAQNSGDAETLTVQTNQGETSVPKDPKTVIVYDLASLDTLDALGVGIDGVPDAPFPETLAKFGEDGTEKAGTLFEPDLEAVKALQPDLIVTGGRSMGKTKALSSIAPTIDMTVDADNFVESAFDRAEVLAEIFGRQKEAETKIAELRASIEELKSEAKDAGTGLILLTTGDKISAFGPGSRFGVLHDAYGIAPADTGFGKGDHGEAVSFEYIAKTDPDWLFVIDRDAAVGRGSAAALLDNELVHGTKAWSKGQVVYLDPGDWYLAASGLRAMRSAVDQLSEALAKKGS